MSLNPYFEIKYFSQYTRLRLFFLQSVDLHGRFGQDISYNIRSLFNHFQISARGRFRPAFSLFPISKRVKGQSERSGERRLRQAQPRPNRFHIDAFRNMNTIRFFRHFAARYGNRFFHALDNTTSDTHVFSPRRRLDCTREKLQVFPVLRHPSRIWHRVKKTAFR